MFLIALFELCMLHGLKISILIKILSTNNKNIFFVSFKIVYKVITFDEDVINGKIFCKPS